MGSRLSMQARSEFKKRYVMEYVKAPKHIKPQILDAVNRGLAEPSGDDQCPG
jgi:hypothetical protein